MDLVPGVHHTLLNRVKFVDADYVTVLDKDGINIYDGKTTKIIISEKAVLSGYHTEDGLCRNSLKRDLQNVNTNILLIQLPLSNKAISYVFELTFTEKTVSYYHSAVGFTTKETWTNAI